MLRLVAIGGGLVITSVFISTKLEDKNRTTGRYRLLIIPEKFDNTLGSYASEGILKDAEKFPSDSNYHICVEELCKILYPYVSIKKNWSINVIKGSQINAFVLPDGSIFVYTGLLDLIDSIDELGFVLAHEISHVLYRHGAEKVSVSIAGALIMLLVQLYITGDMDVYWLTELLVNLPVSRTAESEADSSALDIMSKAGLDMNAGITIMEKFKEKLPELSLEILSTHPLSDHRASEIEKNIAEKVVDSDKPNQEKLLKIKKIFDAVKNELKAAQTE